MQSSSDLSQFHTVGLKLAKQAGAIIRSSLELGAKRDWKSDETPVTIVDKQINQLTIDTIHKEFPTHSILAEEGSDLTRSREYVWVCDPIDGTFPFMHGIPVSTYALALVRDGVPIYGLIYDPFMDRLFSCVKGEGTMLNGQPVRTSEIKDIKNTSIGVVFWQGNMDIFTPLLPKLVERGGKIMNLVSIAYMDAMVAAGEFSATIFAGTSAHDSAAAKIIVEGAGGVYTSLTGEADRYDQSVHGHLACSNQAIYDQVKQLLLADS